VYSHFLQLFSLKFFQARKRLSKGTQVNFKVVQAGKRFSAGTSVICKVFEAGKRLSARIPAPMI
jgi:hypothetical protein